jgi:hypothetical protein
MLKRRAFVAAMTAMVVGALAAEARQPSKVWRIGYLDGSSPACPHNAAGGICAASVRPRRAMG